MSAIHHKYQRTSLTPYRLLLFQRKLDILPYALGERLRCILRLPPKVSAATVRAQTRVSEEQERHEVASKVFLTLFGSEHGRLGVLNPPEANQRVPDRFGQLEYRSFARLDEIVTFAAVAQL